MSHTLMATLTHVGRDIPIERAIELGKQRLCARVKVTPSGCWEWQRYRKPLGYGEMNWRGDYWRVHRLAYRFWKGEIPAGMDVMHTCDVRHCCNPDHLVAAPHRDNLLDCLRKDRKPKTYRTVGVKHRWSRGVTCIHGHVLIGENLYITADGRRRCRKCHLRHVREHIERYRARVDSTDSHDG